MKTNVKIQILEVGPCTFQLIGKSDIKEDEGKLVNAVTKLAVIAEKYEGVPQEMYPHILPAKLIVYATYLFNTGTNAMHFLQECKKVEAR